MRTRDFLQLLGEGGRETITEKEGRGKRTEHKELLPHALPPSPPSPLQFSTKQIGTKIKPEVGRTHVYTLNLILLTPLNDFYRRAPCERSTWVGNLHVLTFMFGTKPFLIRNAFSFRRSIKEHSSLYVRCWAIVGRTSKSFSSHSRPHKA